MAQTVPLVDEASEAMVQSFRGWAQALADCRLQKLSPSEHAICLSHMAAGTGELQLEVWLPGGKIQLFLKTPKYLLDFLPGMSVLGGATEEELESRLLNAARALVDHGIQTMLPESTRALVQEELKEEASFVVSVRVPSVEIDVLFLGSGEPVSLFKIGLPLDG